MSRGTDSDPSSPAREGKWSEVDDGSVVKVMEGVVEMMEGVMRMMEGAMEMMEGVV